MVAYREPDGLEKVMMILASLRYEVRIEERHIRGLAFQLAFFSMLFTCLVAGETMFSMMMFSIIQIEILGSVFSGAAFGMLVPTVVGYAHVRLHHESDHFLRWWLRTLSGIGVLFFALGVSLMIGYSAWQAAQDAMPVIYNGPTGTLGGQTLGGGDNHASSSILDWIGVIPNGLLFVGLSFGMIITISFASFCLGRVLQAFNILTLTPRIEKDVKHLIEGATGKAHGFRKLGNKRAAERRKLPIDVNAKFAREAAHAGWKVGQSKLAAARRVFNPINKNDPLAAIIGDPAAGTIPSHFETEEECIRHFNDVIDQMRAYNLLNALNGTSEGKDTI